MPLGFRWAAGHCKNEVTTKRKTNIVLLNIARGRIAEHEETMWHVAKSLFRLH